MRDTGTDFAHSIRLALIDAGIDNAIAAAFVLEMRKQFGERSITSRSAPAQTRQNRPGVPLRTRGA